MKTLLSLAIILLAAAGNPIAAQCWNLIYEDNFDGTQLRSAYWTARDQPGFSESNGELQYHLVQNVSVYGGALHLVAKKENYGSYPYTSGWVDSKLKVSYRYGRIVSRMKLPAGKGMWPAFWLVPEGEVYGAWPKSGEIDIMENIGSDTRTVYGTFHTVDQAGSHVSNSVPYTLPSGLDFSAAFHDFECQWTPDELRWYVDGVLYSKQNRAAYASWKWPFDQQFYVIYSLAVGGSWPGSPSASTVFPNELTIDYVRVYQSDDLLEIRGNAQVEPGSTTGYAVPDYGLSAYTWQVPAGASILSGQGTKTIQVQWGTDQNVERNITCTLRTPCSQNTITISKSVKVVGNVLDNPGFELGYEKWFRNNAIGAAVFTLDKNNPGAGVQSAKVQVTQVTNEYWRSQLSRNVYGLSGNDRYEVLFLARSDIAGRVMGVSVLNPISYATIGTTTFALTDRWQIYRLSVNLTGTDTAVLLTFDLGHSAGTFWIDGVSFGKAADPLPVKLISFSGHATEMGNLLRWTTEWEVNNDFFELERSSDARRFTPVGRVDGDPARNAGHDYQFLDTNPGGAAYYRLKQVDNSGETDFSRIIRVGSAAVTARLELAPNPAAGDVTLSFDDSDPLIELEAISAGGKRFPLHLVSNQTHVGGLPAGTYMLKARTVSGKLVTRRFVKQ